MDEILNYSKYNIDAVKNLKENEKQKEVNNLIERNQLLEDLIQYEINSELECKNFCNMVNSQLAQSCEEINKKLDTFGNLKSDKIVFKKGNTDNDDHKEENEVEWFTKDINAIKQSYIETSELQLLMNCLPNYLKNINQEYINQERTKIEQEKQFRKNQKIRALEFLYEIQDFCYGFMEVKEKEEKT